MLYHLCCNNSCILCSYIDKNYTILPRKECTIAAYNDNVDEEQACAIPKFGLGSK